MEKYLKEFVYFTIYFSLDDFYAFCPSHSHGSLNLPCRGIFLGVSKNALLSARLLVHSPC